MYLGRYLQFQPILFSPTGIITHIYIFLPAVVRSFVSSHIRTFAQCSVMTEGAIIKLRFQNARPDPNSHS